jgi:hypothetical protein
MNAELSRRSFLAGATAMAAAPGDGFVALFDGKTLKGWRNPYAELKAWVEKGDLCLLSKKPVWLVHEEVFGDFILEADLRVPDGGNGGVQFRTQLEGQKLWGYQAEIDTSTRRWAGGLYDQGRRTWLGPLEGKPEAQAAYRNNEWNRVKVECIADRIRIWMNGVPTVDYIDPLDIEGHVGLQHHGDFQGHPAEVYRFRNLRLKPLGKRRWEPVEKAGLAWEPSRGWEHRGRRVIWRGSSARAAIGMRGKPIGEFTLRFFAKPVQGDARLVLEDTPGPVWVALTPDQRMGLLCRPGFVPLAELPVRKKPFAAPALWNAIAVSNRAGRYVVHVNGIRTADWERPHTAGPVSLRWESASETHLELRDLEMLS